MGALSIYKKGDYSKFDGDLTFAGSVMGQLPVDIKLGKLILLGHSFGKLREAIILAAGLSVKSIIGKWFRYGKFLFKYRNCSLTLHLNIIQW